MKVNKLDHICIAVRNLEAAKKIWQPILRKHKPIDKDNLDGVLIADGYHKRDDVYGKGGS